MQWPSISCSIGSGKRQRELAVINFSYFSVRNGTPTYCLILFLKTLSLISSRLEGRGTYRDAWCGIRRAGSLCGTAWHIGMRCLTPKLSIKAATTRFYARSNDIGISVYFNFLWTEAGGAVRVPRCHKRPAFGHCDLCSSQLSCNCTIVLSVPEFTWL